MDDKTYYKGKLREYLELITTKDTKAGRDMYCCPICGSGTHSGSRSDGALSVAADNETWKCFACNNGGDIFDLIKLNEKIDDFPGQLARAKELFGEAELTGISATDPAGKKETAHKPTEQIKHYLEECSKDVWATFFFTGRGLTTDTIDRFRLGYDAVKKIVTIPYSNSLTYYTARSVDEKNYYKPKADDAGPEPLFNVDALYGNTPCFVCEGPIDAISVTQAGGAAIALGGCGSRKLLNQITIHKPTQPLILCFDNDEAGIKGADDLARELDALEIHYIKADFAYSKYLGSTKDANDLLRANPAQFAADIRRNIVRAWSGCKNELCLAGDFIANGNYEESVKYFSKYKNRKTGFKAIDDFITLYPGLAILGAPASLGKTTFAVNLADNLSAAGETVLYFSLEQSKAELITKSIARKLYERNPFSPLTNIDIKEGCMSDELQMVMDEYSKTSNIIYITEAFDITAQRIRETVESFIAETGIRPIVIIDYLQIISPEENASDNIRGNVITTLKSLKRMQLDNELFVLLISSLNRQSYMMPLSYESFKESGEIEQTADYVWGLQLAVLDNDIYNKEGRRQEKIRLINEANSQYPKRVNFVCIKNRNGKQYGTASFNYYMRHDTYVPKTEQPAYEGFTRCDDIDFDEDDVA